MTEAACTAFLKWALPQLHLRWRGFERNRRQVCHRIDRRRAELGLPDLAAYRQRLETDREEWAHLDALCRVTISRFARDRSMWDELVASVLPRLAREAAAEGRTTVHAWSAGCGAGEEPFTLVIAWELAIVPDAPGIAIDVLATDVDDHQLARAVEARFPMPPLRELPAAWVAAAFEQVDGEVRVRDRFRTPVRFVHHDVRTGPAAGPFDLVLCRNLAFSYFDEAVQREVAAGFRSVLRPGGALVVGLDEHLPADAVGFEPSSPWIYVASRDR